MHVAVRRYPGQPNITQPTTHLAKVKWEAPGPNLWVSKLRRFGGRYVGGRLAEFRDPQVGVRHRATAVSAKNGRESAA